MNINIKILILIHYNLYLYIYLPLYKLPDGYLNNKLRNIDKLEYKHNIPSCIAILL